MAKSKSAEFSDFRKKLHKFYRNGVQTKNKAKDPEVAKLIKELNVKPTKQEKQQLFDSFVTGLAKKEFAQEQLMKKYVKKVTEYVRSGLKNSIVP